MHYSRRGVHRHTHQAEFSWQHNSVCRHQCYTCGCCRTGANQTGGGQPTRGERYSPNYASSAGYNGFCYSFSQPTECYLLPWSRILFCLHRHVDPSALLLLLRVVHCCYCCVWCIAATAACGASLLLLRVVHCCYCCCCCCVLMLSLLRVVTRCWAVEALPWASLAYLDNTLYEWFVPPHVKHNNPLINVSLRLAAIAMVLWVMTTSGVLYYAYETSHDVKQATCNSPELVQIDVIRNTERTTTTSCSPTAELAATLSAENCLQHTNSSDLVLGETYRAGGGGGYISSSALRASEKRIFVEKQRIRSDTLPRLKMEAAFVPIALVLAAPSFFYSISTSIPDENNLGIDTDMLRAFDYVAPLVFVLIESFILPQAACQIEKFFRNPKSDTCPGTIAISLMQTANLTLFWLVPIVSIVLMDENCLAFWLRTWSR